MMSQIEFEVKPGVYAFDSTADTRVSDLRLYGLEKVQPQQYKVKKVKPLERPKWPMRPAHEAAGKHAPPPPDL